MKNTIDQEKLPKGYRKYQIKGVDRTIIAKKGGPSAGQIKTEASYQVVRNHQKEFGIASMVAKMLRESLNNGLHEVSETYSSGKLTARFRNLTKIATGEVGMRPLLLSHYGNELEGFEFNSPFPFDTIFNTKFHVTNGSERGEIIWHFPAFVPTENFKAPKLTSSFKIRLRVVALSDFVFDETSGSYLAKHKELHGAFGAFDSPMFPMLKTSLEPLTTHVTVNSKHPTPENMSLFLMMGVSFYSQVGGKFKHLAKNSSLKIHGVL